MTLWTANTQYTCGWTMDDDCSPCKDKLEPLQNPALFQRCVDSAAEILYALSGRQFGLCETVVRPCRLSCCDPCDMSGPRWTPVLVGGQWTNVSCGSCGDSCSCPNVCELTLPGRIHEVVRVVQDGIELGPTQWRVDGLNSLVRRPGKSTKVAPITGLVSDGGNITFSDDASYPAGSTPDGVLLPTVGNNYTIMLKQPPLPLSDVANFPRDICVDVVIQAGSGSGSFNVGQPSGVKSVTVISGGGTASLQSGFIVNYSGPGLANSDQVVRVCSESGGPYQQINITPNDDALVVSQISYTVLGDVSEPQCWPTCQDMSADAAEPNTFEVTYLRGKPVPEAGRGALAELACELCLACLGDDCCALPKRVTSIQREGVTMAMLDPMTFIPMGLTGLYAVDLWLHSVNPKARVRSGAILSPDMPNNRISRGI